MKTFILSLLMLPLIIYGCSKLTKSPERVRLKKIQSLKNGDIVRVYEEAFDDSALLDQCDKAKFYKVNKLIYLEDSTSPYYLVEVYGAPKCEVIIVSYDNLEKL